MSEPTATGAVVRLNDESLSVDGYIRVEQITTGPNRGLWLWQIHTPPRATNRGNQAMRSGIAQCQGKATATAKKALAWHLSRAEQGQ
jgi:hypothetical protein